MENLHTLSFVAGSMFAISLFNSDKWSKRITAFLALGLVLLWIDESTVQQNGMRLYIISTASVILYAILHKKLPKVDRIGMIILSIFAFLALVFENLHWAHYNELVISMIFPLTAYAFLLNRGLVKRNEFAFLSILFAHCLLRFLQNWTF